MLIEASKGGHVDVAALLLNHGSGHAAPPPPAAAATPSVKSKMQTAKSAQLTAKIKKSQKAPVIVVDDHPGPPKPSPVAPPSSSATSSIDAATFPSFASIPPTALYTGMGLTETDAIAMATELNRRFIPPPPTRSPPRLSVDEIEERISPEGQEKPRIASASAGAVTSSSTTTTSTSSSIINSLALESGAETLQQFALMAKKFAAAETATAATTSGDDAPGHGFNFTFNGAEGAGAGQVDSLEFATPDLPSEATAAALGLSGKGAGFQPAGVLAGAEEAQYGEDRNSNYLFNYLFFYY